MNIMVESGTELSSAWSLESRELERSRRGIEDSTHPYKHVLAVNPQGDEPIVSPGSQDQITSMLRFTSWGLRLQYIAFYGGYFVAKP